MKRAIEMSDQINVLVVDDSVVYRRVLSSILKEIDGVEVLGSAPNGKIALDKIERLKPDLVTLDIDMPVMDGIETLKHISKEFPEIPVVMVSAHNRHSADQTVEALGLGSLDFIVKPNEPDFASSKKLLKEQLSNIIDIVKRGSGSSALQLKQRTRAILRPTPESANVVKAPLPKVVKMVLIGSSTGGPKALEELIPKLPKNFFTPILLAQHMPPLFTQSLAKNLNEMSHLEVCEAKDGQSILPGNVYIAPGGQHMTVARGEENDTVIRLDESPPVNSCRPSVDILFESVSRIYQSNKILSVIMTGMGVDGVNGVRALNEQGGGYCLTQSEQSCVVYGMPRSIVEAGLGSEAVDLKDLADRIVEISMS